MGRRIAEARGRAGLTQADLAAAIPLDRSALAKIESGARRVSALELARIADAVGERIEWFVMRTPDAIVSHRNMQEPGAESPSIDRKVEQVSWHTEFLAKHDPRLNLDFPSPLPRPTNGEEAERSAVKVRKLLGLEADEPFFNMSEGLAKLGLLAFSFDLGTDAADGASILLAKGGVAIVNGHLLVGRRRLALAHEFGHYVFADEYSVDWRVADKDDDAWESRLDRFGRAVLLPARGVNERWARFTSDGDDLRTAAVKLASMFRVDMSTLARRLLETGAVTPADCAQIRKVKTTRADIVELNLVVHDELGPPALPRAYEASVLRLYRQEVISPARAADLLFDTWNEDDLPALPTLPETAIWNFV